MKWSRTIPVAAFLIALSACQTQSPAPLPPDGTPATPVPSLTLNPTSVNVNAGDAALPFSASVQNSSESVIWTLSGPGTFSPTRGPSTSYTPPERVDSTQFATLTATLETTGASASAPIAIYAASVTPPAEPPEPAPPLTTPPSTPPTTPPATPPATPPEGDTKAPTIVSISPAKGATGVATDAKIVITFSEAMQKADTEAAYSSAELPASGVTFGWDADAKVLTLTPKSPLKNTLGTDPNAVIAVEYAFTIGSDARDAAGNRLTPVTSSFATASQISATFKSLGALDGTSLSDGTAPNISSDLIVGDDVINVGYRGFVSFDLSSIPDAVTSEQVLSAELSLYRDSVEGNPYGDLDTCTGSNDICETLGNSVDVEHLDYGSVLTGGAYSQNALGRVGSLTWSRFDSAPRYESVDALAAVRDDLGKFSQYRISFPLQTDGGSDNDYVMLSAGEGANPPLLKVTYMLP